MESNLDDKLNIVAPNSDASHPDFLLKAKARPNDITIASNNKSDSAIIEQEITNHAEKSSTYPQSRSTYPQQFIHGAVLTRSQSRVSAADIKALSCTIFERTGRGLTFRDLLKGQYKRAATPKQAQRMLQYHRMRGNLHTNTPIRIPQEYFSSREDADLSASYNKKNRGLTNHVGKSSTYPQPTEVPSPTNPLETQKADSLYEAIDFAASHLVNGLPTGFHNILVHVKLNNPEEAYNERLNYKTNPHIYYTLHANSEKRLETKIDGYNIQASVFPKGKVIISIPCSNNPFPIAMHSSSQTTSDFNSLIAQIRHWLVDSFSDYRGVIVPPIHSDCGWRLVHADINWDIETTAAHYARMTDIQITKVNDIIVRVYRKRLEGKNYVRVEEGVHQFNNTPIGEDVDIGPIIISAAELANQRLTGNREQQEQQEEELT